MKENSKDKKTKLISFRCTEKEYQDIEKLAKKVDMSLSEYLLSQKSPAHCRSSREKKRLPALISLQQTINDIADYYSKKAEQDDYLMSILNHMEMEVSALWG